MLPDAERLCGALAESLRPGLPPDTALVGIHTGGVWVAERLHAALGLKTPLGPSTSRSIATISAAAACIPRSSRRTFPSR